MTSYEKMLRVMRRQAAAERPKGVQLGVVNGAGGVTVGELELEREDLLIPDHLRTGYLLPDGETAKAGLQRDDVVLVQRLSESVYAVVARVE